MIPLFYIYLYMYIQKIIINNFKSIYNPLEIDFNNTQGFWKISGPVGSGKTTIGEAVIFGLFGSINGKNNSDLISWGEKHSTIELWCTSKGHNLYIKRELNSYGQSPLYVEIDGEELVFTNKRDAQTQLEKEYYDTSRTALEMLCIISFNNFNNTRLPEIFKIWFCNKNSHNFIKFIKTCCKGIYTIIKLNIPILRICWN